MVHKIIPSDPHDLAAEVLRHLEWMRQRGYSEATIYSREGRLGDLVAWCRERDVTQPAELSLTVLELYQKHLAHRRKPDGEVITHQTQSFVLTAVRVFCSYLVRRRLIAHNPAAELELPRTPTRIPRNVLSPQEAEQVLAVPDVKTPFGLRDRAMLETLYSTGVRRAELARLEISDLDRDREALLIREGKNRKDRIIPIGERAVAWVSKYLEDGRPELVVPPDDGVLFLNRFGKAFSPSGISRLVRKLVKASGIPKQGSAHMFRHTMATAMLEGGADIRYIQQMLGHSSLRTTQVYTQVSVKQLKEVHTQTHPGARLRRRRDERGEGSREAGERRATKMEKSSRSGPSILLDEEENEEDGEDQVLLSLVAEAEDLDVN